MEHPGVVLSDEERLDWLRLIRSENVGPVTFYNLLRYYGSARAALERLPELARRGGRKRTVRLFSAAAAEHEMKALAKAGARLVAVGEPDYPRPIAAIDDAPPLIAMRGDPRMAGRRCVALVGARNASANGRRLAAQLAGALGEAGLVVVSGLARGIDAAAHEAALGTGTVAVVAGGVDVVYPRETAGLHDEIAARGAILAEQPVGTEPQGRHFPRRNRIISGLSLGTVVVEAAPRSGSLITARMALEQGREVFAVPGSPLDPRSRGANNLIREGATLTESVDDILRVIEPQMAARRAHAAPAMTAPAAPSEAAADADETARAAVLELLSPEPAAVDELIRGCHMTAPVIATVLLELELAGRIERHPGNRVSLIAE